MNNCIDEIVIFPKELVFEISSYFSDALTLVAFYSTCKHCKYCLEDNPSLSNLAKIYVNKVIEDPTLGNCDFDETIKIESFNVLVLLLDSIMYASPNCLKYHSKYTCILNAIKTKNSARFSWLINKTNMLNTLTSLENAWRTIYKYWMDDSEYGELLKVIYDQCKSHDESCCLTLAQLSLFYSDMNFILLNYAFLTNTYNKKDVDLTFIKVIYRAVCLYKLTIPKATEIIKNIELMPEPHLLNWIINIIDVAKNVRTEIIDTDIGVIRVDDKILIRDFTKSVSKILVNNYDANPEKYGDCATLINSLRKNL
jgi:thiol-disulfide isomerase/thioredoxin